MKKILAITLLSCCLLRSSEGKNVAKSILNYDLSQVEQQLGLHETDKSAREFKRFFAIFATYYKEAETLPVFSSKIDAFWNSFKKLSEYEQFCKSTFGKNIEQVDTSNWISNANRQKETFKQHYSEMFNEEPAKYEWNLEIVPIMHSIFGPIPCLSPVDDPSLYHEILKSRKKNELGYSHPKLSAFYSAD